MIIKYFDATQKKFLEIEVNDEVGKVWNEENTKIGTVERNQRRYERSLDALIDTYELEPADPNVDIEQTIIDREDAQRLQTAIARADLNTEQRDLLRSVFFYGKTIGQVAEEKGVDHSAISHRLERIYKKLKEILK
jgi:RNA polymerase sigma-70 factor (ECF subfamily)